MKPPIFWRAVNMIRAWSESDSRLLVEQWKSAYAPVPKAKANRNLILIRGSRDVWQRTGQKRVA